MTRCRFHRQNSTAFVLLLWLIASIVACTTDAFVAAPLQQQRRRATQFFMAGFGGASSPKKNNKKNKTDSTKRQPLKPRKQWGLFLGDDLKDADTIRVAVRPIATTDNNNNKKWYEVGAVKSKDNAHTDAAVIRHRSLINEHARRMFPLQILAKDTLEYGYTTTAAGSDKEEASTAEEWTLVAKVDQMPDDIDTRIGFKGNPDPTGFYAFTDGTGLKAGDSTDQQGYLNMKSKAITGHTGHEIHD